LIVCNEQIVLIALPERTAAGPFGAEIPTSVSAYHYGFKSHAYYLRGDTSPSTFHDIRIEFRRRGRPIQSVDHLTRKNEAISSNVSVWKRREVPQCAHTSEGVQQKGSYQA
jgi:hypothetical protein